MKGKVLKDGTIIEGGSLSGLISKPKIYNWKPAKDITAYELALCLPALFRGGWDVQFIIEDLPGTARRHFEEAE
jgi:hypothetical protein